jgi:hypothetical protein
MNSHTAEGFIPHARCIWRGHVVNAPVCVHIRRISDRDKRLGAFPIRTANGGLVYALPMGDRVVVHVDHKDSSSYSRVD